MGPHKTPVVAVEVIWNVLHYQMKIFSLEVTSTDKQHSFRLRVKGIVERHNVRVIEQLHHL